jgi:hypothetical protein
MDGPDRAESDTDLGTVASVISSGAQIERDSGTINDYQHKEMQNIRSRRTRHRRSNNYGLAVSR